MDHAEEVVMEGYRTATLDLKRRNRSSVPYADSEDDVCINLNFGDGSRKKWGLYE